MSSYGKLENFSLASLYSPRNKLALYVYDRSREAFRRAERRRARVKTADDFYKYQQQNRANLRKALGDIPYNKSLPLNARVARLTLHYSISVAYAPTSRPAISHEANFGPRSPLPTTCRSLRLKEVMCAHFLSKQPATEAKV